MTPTVSSDHSNRQITGREGVGGLSAWSPLTRTISQPNLSLAWLSAFEYLIERRGKAVNLMVVMPGGSVEDSGVRAALDAFLASGAVKDAHSVDTVAGTIFPRDLYFPRLKDRSREHLYTQYQRAYPHLRRHSGNQFGTYFGRLIAWDGSGKERTTNQLERIVQRLNKEFHGQAPKSSAYELAFSDLDDFTDEMRVQHPGDTRLMGFPCLSHISLTLHEGRLHLSALYRNQHFIRRAYGNYLGLSWLLEFICREVGCESGEIACWATHADAEVSQKAGLELIKRCREGAGGLRGNGIIQ